MEDHVGAMGLQQDPHPIGIGDVADADADIQVRGQTPQFPFQKELAVFRTVDQYQSPGRKLQQLPADLRADAAGAAGDQQHAIIDPAMQLGHVQPDRLAAQQVLDRDFARAQVHGPAQQLLVTRQDPHVNPGLASQVHQLANLLSRQLAGRDEDV